MIFCSVISNYNRYLQIIESVFGFPFLIPFLGSLLDLQESGLLPNLLLHLLPYQLLLLDLRHLLGDLLPQVIQDGSTQVTRYGPIWPSKVPNGPVWSGMAP